MIKVYDMEKIVSLKIFEKEEMRMIVYESGKAKGTNNKWYHKVINFLKPGYKEGYYIDYGLQQEGPYTKEFIEEEYNVVIEENIVYKKPYIIITFTGGESELIQFNSIQELENHIYVFDLYPKNLYIVNN